VNEIIHELQQEYGKLHTARSFFDCMKGQESTEEEEEEEEIKLTSEEKVSFKEYVSAIHELKRVKLRQIREKDIKLIEGTKDEAQKEKESIDKQVKDLNKELDIMHKAKLKEIDLL